MTSVTDQVDDIVAGRSPVPDQSALKSIVGRLKQESRYAQARQLLTFLLATQPAAWVSQKLALCTYDDEELPTAKRLRDALVVLEERLNLRSPETRDAETLGLGGAIHKRLWEHTGQLEHLHEALAFYRAANERDWRADNGYGGVNAAFPLDVLAARARAQARRSGTASDSADATQQDAVGLRGKLEGELVTLAAAGRHILLIGGGLLAIGGAAAAATAWNWLFPARPRHNYIGKTAGMLVGWIIAQLHLRFFDARFLERGSLDRLLSLGAAPAAEPPVSPPPPA